MQIEGKRVIVTGGSSGMGEAAVRVFVRDGALVAALDVQDERGASVAAAANDEGPGRAVYHHCDVRRRDEVQTSFARAVEDLGGLDALVHIAGVEGSSSAEEMTEEEWDRVVDVNLKGTFLTNQAAFPYLRGAGGRILNFASSAGLIMFPNHGHYVASKAGVIAWSRSLALEWGRYGINVNAITPFALTPMTRDFQEALSSEARAAFEAHVAATPAGRLGDPETDIAPVLVFLLSDASRYVTAQIIGIDGGNVPVR